jgi:hypothetical protein
MDLYFEMIKINNLYNNIFQNNLIATDENLYIIKYLNDIKKKRNSILYFTNIIKYNKMKYLNDDVIKIIFNFYDNDYLIHSSMYNIKNYYYICYNNSFFDIHEKREKNKKKYNFI